MTGLVVRWACVMVGLIYFTTESAFFAPVRVRLARSSDFLRMLLYCRACSGFWLGLLILSVGAARLGLTTPRRWLRSGLPRAGARG